MNTIGISVICILSLIQFARSCRSDALSETLTDIDLTLDLHIRRIQDLKKELNVTLQGLCHKFERERSLSCERTRAIVQTPEPTDYGFQRNSVIGKLNYTAKQYTENGQHIVRIQHAWQTISVHSDRTLTTEEIKLCAQSLHNTVFLITRKFKFTRESFARVRLPANVDVFAYENRLMYAHAAGLMAEEPVGQTCGVSIGEKIYISLSNCVPFYGTFAHEYAHYLNIYLLQVPPKADWWNEGLATYVTSTCVNNTQYYGREGLKTLFKHGTNPYTDGLILHTFLDSTPELNEYKLLLWSNMREAKNTEDTIKDILYLYGNLFKTGYYCRINNNWLQL